jgi:hypothetical protein
MTVCGALGIVAVLVGGLTSGPASAASGQPKVSKVETRVFYLQEMDPREAVTLLRSQAQVRQVAWVSDRDVVVVAGTADTVDRCATLLREHDAILRVVAPHEPVELGGPAGAPLATGVFHVLGDHMQTVVVLLRSIYQIRELTEHAQDSTVSVHATQPVLESSEALFRELKLLVSTESSEGS